MKPIAKLGHLVMYVDDDYNNEPDARCLVVDTETGEEHEGEVEKHFKFNAWERWTEE